MNINVISKANYLNYKDFILWFFGVDVSKTVLIDNENVDIDLKSLENQINVQLKRKGLKWYRVNLMTGNISSKLLQKQKLYGCTTFWRGEIQCFVICSTKLNNVNNVIIHELCHANRITKIKLCNIGQYYKYIQNIWNRVYEEMLAIAFEKCNNKCFSWEDIIHYEEHRNFSHYKKKIEISRNDKENFKKVITEYGEEAIYFCAYYIDKNIKADIYFEYLYNTNAIEGLKLYFV